MTAFCESAEAALIPRHCISFQRTNMECGCLHQHGVGSRTVPWHHSQLLLPHKFTRQSSVSSRRILLHLLYVGLLTNAKRFIVGFVSSDLGNSTASTCSSSTSRGCAS